MIKKGSFVFVRTVNGGVAKGHLLEDYRPTFTAVIVREDGSELILPGWRIESVEIASDERDDRDHEERDRFDDWSPAEYEPSPYDGTYSEE